MKKLLVTIAAVLVSVSAFAQGSVTFNNRTAAGDVKIATDTTGAGAGSVGASAGLFLLNGTTYTLVPGSTTTFRTTPAAATFFVNPLDVVVPGVPAGASATFQVRAWTGASYDAALTTVGAWSGKSADFKVAELSGTDAAGNIHVPTDISGLQAFTITQTVPEPSTIALGVLGAAALFIRRRK